MGALAGWIQQIGFLVMLAGVIEILLPDTGVRGVVRFVVGLVVILAVVQPLVVWVGDPDRLDNLFWDATAPESERYLEVGKEMGRAARDTAQTLWQERVEAQMSALISLTDGVQDAQVAVSLAPDGSVRRLDVRLVSGEISNTGADSGAVAASASVNAETHSLEKRTIENKVRNVISHLSPQLDGTAIFVSFVGDQEG